MKKEKRRLLITCDPSCATCSGITSTDCDTCSTGLYLLNNQCHSSCPAGYFEDGANCSPCDSKCISCESSATDCTACTTSGAD